MALMSTSLKVVSMAVVFFTETRRCANFLRRGVIFFLSSSRVPPSPFSPPKPLLMAFSTSALVMRPSFPVPFTFSILFSSISFFAEGEGTFLAYVSFFSFFLFLPFFPFLLSILLLSRALFFRARGLPLFYSRFLFSLLSGRLSFHPSHYYPPCIPPGPLSPFRLLLPLF